MRNSVSQPLFFSPDDLQIEQIRDHELFHIIVAAIWVSPSGLDSCSNIERISSEYLVKR